ncbi:MAG: hypothetical protein WCO05_03065 [Candidatus Moraniibacteriota bacterium]|jgi:hypothetical protein
MYKKVIIMVMALSLVIVIQSQSHAEQRIFKISGALKDVIFDINKLASSHAAFYFENGAMIVLSDIPKEGVVFEKGKMCIIRYTSSTEFRDGGYGSDHFLSIEYGSN